MNILPLRIPAFVSCLIGLVTAISARASDWPQLQHDAARTGRGAEEVAPPYRARWLWFGPGGTLRNRLSKPNDSNWTNDLTAGVGRSYPMPGSVPFTLAGLVEDRVARADHRSLWAKPLDGCASKRSLIQGDTLNRNKQKFPLRGCG